MMKFCGAQKEHEEDTYCCIIKYERIEKPAHKHSTRGISKASIQQKEQISQQNNNKSTTRQRVSLSKRACQNKSQNKVADGQYYQQCHTSKRLHLQSFNYLAKTTKAKQSEENIQKRCTGFPQRLQYHTPHHHHAPNIEYFQGSQKSDAKLLTKQGMQRKPQHYDNGGTPINNNMIMQRETRESSTKEINPKSVDQEKTKLFEGFRQMRDITKKSLKLSSHNYSNQIKQSLSKLHGESSKHGLVQKDIDNLPIIRNLSQKLNTVISINDSKADSNNQFNVSKGIPQRQPQQSVNRIDESVIIMNFFHPQGQLKEQIEQQLRLHHQ